MKLVIELPDEVKKAFDNADDINFSFYDYNSVIGKAIRNATPLEEILEDIENGIQATNSKDAYSTGMRNGMKWCKSLLDGKNPNFDDCEEPSIKEVLEDIKAEIEQVKAIMNEEIIEHDRKDLINFVNGLNQCLCIIDKHISGKE